MSDFEMLTVMLTFVGIIAAILIEYILYSPIVTALPQG